MSLLCNLFGHKPYRTYQNFTIDNNGNIDTIKHIHCERCHKHIYTLVEDDTIREYYLMGRYYDGVFKWTSYVDVTDKDARTQYGYHEHYIVQVFRVPREKAEYAYKWFQAFGANTMYNGEFCVPEHQLKDL